MTPAQTPERPVIPDTPTREPMAGEMPEAVVYREWTQRALNSLRFLRQIARANGYAAAVHGSLMRDLDVVCVPWTEEAVSPDDLVEKIAKMMSDEDCPVYVTKKLMADKPHGRLSTVLHFKNEPFSYIDLSVMPTASPPQDAPAATYAECERLRAQLAAAQEDTARIDWLQRTVPSGEFRLAVERVLTAHHFEPTDYFDLRAALDAARGEENGNA